MRYLIGFIIGLLVMMVLTPYTTFYILSCDTERFGPMWINQKDFEVNGFQCLNSNQIIMLEQRPEVIIKLLKSYMK